MTHPITLTPWQKLEALSMRFYGRHQWNPAAGDRYTTSRADLELYEVVAIRDGQVQTRYCDPARGNAISTWEQEEFLSPQTFGYARVYVHPACLKPHPRDLAPAPQPAHGDWWETGTQSEGER